MRPLPAELRRQVVAAFEAGESAYHAGVRLGISNATVFRWYAQIRDTGALAPKPLRGDWRSPRINDHAEAILAALAAEPETTLAHLHRVLAGRGIHFDEQTIRNFLDRHGIELKRPKRKNRCRSST